MKIVMLMGSPRRGDSERVCGRIEERLCERFPGLQVEYLRPARMRIEPCRGCSICFQKGEEYCPIDDDAAEVRRTLSEANGIVFTSPVYAARSPAVNIIRDMPGELSGGFPAPPAVLPRPCRSSGRSGHPITSCGYSTACAVKPSPRRLTAVSGKIGAGWSRITTIRCPWDRASGCSVGC